MHVILKCEAAHNRFGNREAATESTLVSALLFYVLLAFLVFVFANGVISLRRARLRFDEWPAPPVPPPLALQVLRFVRLLPPPAHLSLVSPP
jgi:hypothetical protein